MLISFGLFVFFYVLLFFYIICTNISEYQNKLVQILQKVTFKDNHLQIYKLHLNKAKLSLEILHKRQKEPNLFPTNMNFLDNSQSAL